MPSQKLVRCRIRSRGASEKGSYRYVPLDIFGLWEYLMTHRHGFEVLHPCTSLWLDQEDSPEIPFSERPFDRVTEVSTFVFSGRDDMFTRACRYFPTDECDRLKELFLSHYHDEVRIQSHVRERQGFWLHRQPAEVGTPV